MFYSHEILTSRKYGIATVWLVATLGSNAPTRKINRKAILEVNVAKACKTIVDPGAPLALRLQGNLLYGLSSVYARQCGYALSDAQNAHQLMRMALNSNTTMELDPDAGKARPDQLVHQDDPSFLPDFVLPPLDLLGDMSFLQDMPQSGESQSLTPFGSQQIQDRHTPEGSVGGLIIPSSSPVGPANFGIDSDAGLQNVEDSIHVLENLDLEPVHDSPFIINEDGDIEILQDDQHHDVPLADGRGGGTAQGRSEDGESHQPTVDVENDVLGDGLPMLDDEIPGDDQARSAAYPDMAIGCIPTSDAAEASSSASVAAPIRRQRVPKTIPQDQNVLLRNNDLSDWNQNYLQNMKNAAKAKLPYHEKAQAKKNAEFWVWGAGVGGIGPHIFCDNGPRLYGDDLFQLYTGISRKGVLGQKRDRDSGIDEEMEGESRRVRPRSEDTQVGRGLEDEGISLPDQDVELPRDAATALEEHPVSSTMPWNIHSASIRGSSVVPRSGTGPPSRSRQGRMVSASPLHGRGKAGGTDALQSLGADDDMSNFGLDDMGMPGASSDGLGLIQQTHDTQQSSRSFDVWSAEGDNFLDFAAYAILEKRKQKEANIGNLSELQHMVETEEVTFQELLPPVETSKSVAAQGLIIVLALGTRGLLSVAQNDGFDEDIILSLTDIAWAMQTKGLTSAEKWEPEQEMGEDVIQEENNQSDAQEDDDMPDHITIDTDNDSLYDE